ncbi:MAG: hypothetical protein Q4C70_07935 [Planctomycetia bacterium]|nr:hypothetical protein [Planctomycetia bacterium]
MVKIKVLTCLNVCVLVICSIILTYSASILNAETSLEEEFRSAPMILPGTQIPLKGLPLWHTNGALTDDLIREFFEKGTKNGFGGYTFLPLGREVPTEPKYLTEGYFEYFGKVLDAAKKRGQKVIFYDDVDFPSGTAGGKMKELHPDFCSKRLDMEEWETVGPRENMEFRFSRKLNQNWNDGMFQAAVAMNLETWERIDLTAIGTEIRKETAEVEKETGAEAKEKTETETDAEAGENADTETVTDERILWDVPAGKWVVMVFYVVTDGNKVDNMDPEAMEKFISLTYDVFYERFPEHFGTTIPVCFFDDVTMTQTEGGRNWTGGFNKKYEEMYRKSPATDYPAAFRSIGPDTASARYRIWTVRNELFADGYAKCVHDWCAEHGIMSSGHPQGPYTIQPNNMCGDEMLTHRSSDAPLFDSIHYYGHGRDGFKVPTSAAYNFDKPLCLVEIYGNYRDGIRHGKPEFDDKMLYRSAMEIFCRGGNVLLPHGIWTNPEKMYIPPDISWRNGNLKGELPKYGDWVSRISLILRDSRHVADIGIVYPIENLNAYYYFYLNFPPGEYPYGLYIPPETDYMAVGSDLTSRIYRDFTYLHPVTMKERCKIQKSEDGRTVYRLDNEKNWEEYEVLILSGAEVISWKTLERVCEFHRQGGKVLATTRLPSRAAEGVEYDVQVCEMIQELFGVDPRAQGMVEALKCGQEDITLAENFRAYRAANVAGQYEMAYPDMKSEKLAEIRKERVIFLPTPTPDKLRVALDVLVAVPDVRIESHDGKKLPTVEIPPRWSHDYDGMVQYIHKVKDGRDFYFVANSSDSRILLDVTLRGNFGKLEIWDPITGKMESIPSEKISVSGKETKISGLEFQPVEALFIVGDKK